MKSLKKLWIAMTIPVLGCFLLHVTVYAGEDSWPLVYTGQGDEITYLTDVGNTQTYEVKERDTLWGIAKEKMGSGSSYQILAAANSELIADPNLILPGIVLQIPAGGVRLKGSSGIRWKGCYRYATPAGWTLGYVEAKEAWANQALLGREKGHIACLIQDIDDDTVENTRDFEIFCEQIRSYAAEKYPDTVSDLTFQYYETEEGEKVYLYSYIYEMPLEAYGLEGSYPVNVCMGIHLTEHIQAQFLGFGNNEKIQKHVLYTAGTFEELEKDNEKSLAELSNMAIEPVYSWELSGLFNPFPWVEQYFDGVMRGILNIPEEKSIKEKFLG